MKLCATDPLNGEFTLCGDAFDICETRDGADVEPFRFARIGETVTCERCRVVINTIRLEYPKGYKLK